MAKYWIFGLVFLLMIASAMAAVPVVTWLNQTPVDISTTQLETQSLIIWANITDADDNVDNSTVKIYFKTNTTGSDISYFVNGVAYSGYNNTRLYDTNITTHFKFLGYQNAVYPGIFNLDWLYTRKTAHTASPLASSSNWLKVRFLNVSSTKGETYVAVMVNNSAGTDYGKVYYCNSSYTTGAITTSNWCVFIYNIPTNTYPHCHPNNISCHFMAPMPIVDGKLGTVDVTSTSYILVNGRTGSTVQYWYLSNNSNTVTTSANNGVTWTAQTHTADILIHQFEGTDKFTYKICASDGTNETCTAEISQLLIAGDIPDLPTAPDAEIYETGVCPITDSLQSTLFFIAIGIFIFAIFIISEVMPQLPPVLGFLPGVGMIFYSLPLFGCHIAYGLVMLIFAIILIINAWQKAFREAGA